MRIAQSKKVLLITPRTHPNLRYLCAELIYNGLICTLLVQKRSDDFDPPEGLTVITNKEAFDKPDKEFFDVVIYRYYLNEAMKAAQAISKPGASEISYDQHPIGDDFISKFFSWRIRIVSKFKSRPSLRVSPVKRVLRDSVSTREYYFKHPGPVAYRPLLKKQHAQAQSAPVKVIIVAKRYNSRKKTLLALSALEQVRRKIEVTLVQAEPSFTNRSLPRWFEKRLDKKLEKKIQNSQLGVLRFSNLPHEEIMNHFSTSDIHLFPSKRESFGIVNLEAASRGVLSFSRKTHGSYSSMPADSVVGLKWPVNKYSIAKQITQYIDSTPDTQEKKLMLLKSYERWSNEGPWLSDAIRKISNQRKTKS